MFVISELGRQRQGDSWNSLASQPSLLGEFQISKETLTVSNNKKVENG